MGRKGWGWKVQKVYTIPDPKKKIGAGKVGAVKVGAGLTTYPISWNNKLTTICLIQRQMLLTAAVNIFFITSNRSSEKFKQQGIKFN